jgi:CRISPR-associated protein Csx10
MRARLLSFKDIYEEIENSLCAIAHDPPEANDRILFTINLRSDVLLRTPSGLPTLVLSEAMLHDLLLELASEQQQAGEMLDGLGLKLVAQYTQPLHVSGWQTAWKLPKEVLLASRMGGLYAFSMLGRLESAGIGEMREDGYGQITICDQFHLEVEAV